MRTYTIEMLDGTRDTIQADTFANYSNAVLFSVMDQNSMTHHSVAMYPVEGIRKITSVEA